MRFYGADDETIAEVLDDGAEDSGFEVWPENWPTLELFIACRHTWAHHAMGGLIGLRAEGVESIMRMKRVPVKAQWALFDDVMAMAGEAMTVLNKKHG